MSSRLGQTISRYNAALGHSQSQDGGGQAQGQAQGDGQPSTITSVTGGGSGGLNSAVHAIAHQPPPSHYKGHRGHRRGHSYGGVVSPPTSGIHHSQLEARPSHPNTHHGVLVSHGSSALQKGHRRALSGCLPMVGMGAVAWSSLRDLETVTPHGSHFGAVPTVRSLSPEESRPSSPDGVIDAKGTLKLTAGSQGDFKKDGGYKKEVSLESMECGLGPCRFPDCVQSLATIQFFVGILAVLVTLQQAVASGYVNSVITTIETRFEIPSRFSGLVASSYEMGNVVTVLFVSYLGAKRHIPRWIATGVMVMVVGCIVFTLPHFLSPDNHGSEMHDGHHSINYQYMVNERLINPRNDSSTDYIDDDFNNTYTTYNVSKGELNDTASRLRGSVDPSGNAMKPRRRAGRNSVCHSANPQSSRFISGANNRLSLDLEALQNGGVVDGESHVRQELMSVGCSVEVIEEDGTKTTKPSQESYGHPLILFMLAQLLLGCGGSPLFTLGITYVDDHVPAESSSVYIGIVYATAAFGPVLGFLVGAGLLSIPSTSTSTDSHLLNPDAQFIGMWWGGFLIAGALLFVAALPFLAFPRIVASKKVEEEPSNPSLEDSSITDSKQEALDSGAYGQSIKDIPRSIWRLITNPTYVLTCLGGCMELNIVSGFVVFLPKYLETQFSMGKSEASLYTGGIAIPGACFGIFFGGYLMKKMQMKPSGACKFVVITNIICLVGYVFFFFLGCSNPNLAGATVSYPGTPLSPSLELNLTNTCNSECSCDSSLDAQYVCHEGVTYFSPCHAGCSVNLTQCSCAGGESVLPGACPDKPCNTLLPFMIVLFFMTATVAITQMPLLMIVLRSVSSEERSFALGMQFVIFRLLGYIPSPIVFGNVIDSACLLWSIKRCSTLLPAVSGRCLLYDIQDFRYKYVGMLSGLKLLALALFLYDLYQLRKKEKREDSEASANAAIEQNNLKLASNSIISLDKLVQESDSESATTNSTTATFVAQAAGINNATFNQLPQQSSFPNPNNGIPNQSHFHPD